MPRIALSSAVAISETVAKYAMNYEAECLFGLSFPGGSMEAAKARFEETVLEAEQAGWGLPDNVEVRGLRDENLGCYYGVFEPFYWVRLEFRSPPITGVVPRGTLDRVG
jgi:hypothetical protein